MTYEEALSFISRQGRFGMKLGTERTRAILNRIGAPDRGLKGALIAGTNGKGSTGACLAAILRAAGRNVGFMPKPHLISYTERIELNGRPISETEFVETLDALMPALDAIAAEMGQATEFEMLTAMARSIWATPSSRSPAKRQPSSSRTTASSPAPKAQRSRSSRTTRRQRAPFYGSSAETFTSSRPRSGGMVTS